ncbi:hypothetical protein AA0117_g9778 [Alternaria alternata]|uniref:Uncharacterized protein n=2 Tax=Alternaria alternata complex TaxID=187734 RepID=A0A4Q4N785_ALTAL|nr:hypothetical protein AA0115_g5929 [Alternaria tenuissima]RYN71198.1 hypothetical protein AA0117_g9778 [Alternaria alternata]RYO18909.1 hypothetical protein AA0121_g4592 [Alternaria tenuissima]
MASMSAKTIAARNMITRTMTAFAMTSITFLFEQINVNLYSSQSM